MQSVRAAVIGAFGGAFGSSAGVGGGVIMIPLLTRFAHVTQHQAHAASLAAVVSTGTVGALGYAAHGHIDYLAASAIAVSALASVRVGAKLAFSLSSPRLGKVFAVFLLGVGPMVPLAHRSGSWAGDTCAEQGHAAVSGPRPRVSAEAEDAVETKESTAPAATSISTIPSPSPVSSPAKVPHLRPTNAPPSSSSSTLPRIALFSLLGALAGIASGLLGVGGGVIITPALALAADMPQHTAVGTSLAAMVLPSSLSLWLHHRRGALQGPLALALAAGALVGASCGVAAAMHASQQELRYVFAVGVTLTGLRMLIK